MNKLRKSIQYLKYPQNRNLIYFFIFIILSAIFLFKSLLITEEVLFWTFSTVAQSFLALLAFLGMLAIFKIQLINNDVKGICEAVRKPIEYFRGSIARIYAQEEIIKECYGISEKTHYRNSVPPEFLEVERAAERLRKLTEEKNSIKKAVSKFISYTMFLVFISIVLLPLTPKIETHWLNKVILVGVIILSFYSLTSAAGLVKSLL